MTENRHIWRRWAEYLHRWGMQDVAASLLEAAGSITIIAAQVVYVTQPLLTPTVSKDSLHALASLLEDKEETQAFLTVLREVPHGGSG